MADLLEYKCPCCGGAIHFDSAKQKMKCPYCDTTFEMDALKSYDDALKEEKPSEMHWQTPAEEFQAGECDGIMAYSCNSCGGEIVGDANMAATSCPYCGNPVIMTGRLSGSLRPDYVIPFKLDKKAAKEALQNHCKGKPLLPKIFKDNNHIDEIKGIYVPFWLFDADVEANIRFRATKRRSVGNDSHYDYFETNHYLIVRQGTIGFDHVPVDASSKMADDLMESIEPFDFSDAVDFQTAYLAGYLADKYDLDKEATLTRANQRIKESTENAFSATVTGFDSVKMENSSIRLSNGQAKYALFPVWLLNTSWNGNKYTFAMNGQTGKFVGHLPVDKGAYFKWFIGLTAIATAVLFGLYWLVYLI
jgi:DNA-directed RNA polymerase subunit RPC12/RpoP